MMLSCPVAFVMAQTGSVLVLEHSSSYGNELHGIFGYATSRQRFTPEV
jgi:hypothetical protein